MSQRNSPGSAESRATSTTPIAAPHTTDPTAAVGSQQVSWWAVHEFVTAVLSQVNGWPMLGTPAWCSLTHDHPAKWAALLDGAQHWALRVETCQLSRAEASRAIAVAVHWPKVAQENKQRNDFYAAHPWLRRALR
jgi:hypothetical protein